MRALHVVVVALSCLLLAHAPPAAAQRRTIVITSGDVEGLYQAVGDPANANTRVTLEAGTYVLTADGPNGPRPRGGALLLQEGMELVGQNVYADLDYDGVWDAEPEGNPVIAGETLIDGTGIVPIQDLGTTGQVPTDCTGESAVFDQVGAVVIGFRDRVRVVRLSVKSGFGARGFGEPHPSYLPAGGMSVTVSHCFFDNGTQSAPGVTFANVGCGFRDAISRFTLERSIVRGSGAGVAIVNGLTHQAGDVRRGPSIRATLDHNHILSNGLGVHSRNTLGTDGGKVFLRSNGNRYAFNWGALETTAGTDLGLSSGANGNRFHLHSTNDTFIDNNISLLGVGFWKQGTPTASKDNELHILLRDGTFIRSPVHLWPFFFQPVAGVDKGNRIVFDARGSYVESAEPNFLLIDTVPNDTNTVVIAGTTRAFAASNGEPPKRTQYLVPPVPFDLVGAENALHFAPDADGYTLSTGPGALDLDVGEVVDFSGEPNLDFPIDDDTAELALPFPFTFHGVAYESVFINADGSLTFGEGDPWSYGRDVWRLVSGPPRIAAWLADLAPNMAGAIHARVDPDRVVITWLEVPTWASGLTDDNTAQVTLHADGRIDIVYGPVGSAEGVVGIAPGGVQGPFVDADLSRARGDVWGAAIFQEFFFARGP